MVSQLPEAYREPLMLKAVHGLRTRQIAEALNIEEATVDTRVSRARRMLREMLDEPSPTAQRMPQEISS
jgi:RNA polymerase sigma-70 factor (ECF subfamily)